MAQIIGNIANFYRAADGKERAVVMIGGERFAAVVPEGHTLREGDRIAIERRELTYSFKGRA